MCSIRTFFILAATALFAGCGTTLETHTLFETKTVSQGTYRGLEIGATREVTLDAIRLLGANGVVPIPAESFIVARANIRDVARIEGLEGIRLTNYRGLSIDLFFKEKQVVRVRRSVPAKDNEWFHEGESVIDVGKKLEEVLTSDESLVAFPIVYYEGNGWVDLNQPNSEILHDLDRYSAWKFEVAHDKPAGALFEVFFANDRLARIDYRRARIRLE